MNSVYALSAMHQYQLPNVLILTVISVISDSEAMNLLANARRLVGPVVIRDSLNCNIRLDRGPTLAQIQNIHQRAIMRALCCYSLARPQVVMCLLFELG
mmetsp:Transcript_24445/g.45190  ORF Transcript_24445/g.45190 Transcript_24445/m.45190 type:complete len:99 (+) Transcript_24445:307-603(+)